VDIYIYSIPILWQIYVGLTSGLTNYIQCGLYYVDKRSGYLMDVLLDSVTVCRCRGIKRMKSNIIVFFFIYNHLIAQCMKGLVVSWLHLHTLKYIFLMTLFKNKNFLHLT
jgi:hypothetical protein